MFIMEEFAQWCLLHNSKESLLSQQLKLDAFKLINKQNALALTKIVLETFKMNDERELFHEVVNCMIDKKQYKEVS